MGAFVGKSGLPIDTQYVASGSYYWNSGMFMFKALAEFEKASLRY